MCISLYGKYTMLTDVYIIINSIASNKQSMCVYGCVCVSTMSVINRNFSGKFAFIVCSSSQLFFFMQTRKRIFQFNRIINHHHHHISNDYYFHFQFLLSLDGLHSVILLYTLLFFQLNSYVYVFRFIDCRAKKNGN